jgi:prophage regulatory protein
MNIKFFRLPATLEFRQRSRAGHYADIQNGLWTKPVRVSLRSVAWPEHEIQAINSARLAGKTDDEIRVLVATLEQNRKLAA